MNEITPRAEQTATAEPQPTFTLDQLTQLLREASAYERAQRPIVLHTSAAPATNPQAPGHGGIDVRVPALPVTSAQTPQRPSEHSPWALLFMVSGCTGLAAAATAAATGNQFALLTFFAAVAVWGTSAYQLVFNRA